MDQKHLLPPELVGLAGDVRLLVTPGIVVGGGQSQVPLGVDGVVVDPVGDWGHGDATLEDAVTGGVGGQGGEGDET